MSKNKNPFNHLIANQILSGTSSAFIWLALTFWVFLETQSILATSLIAGVFAILNAITAFPFGWMVDHLKKKITLVISNTLSFLACGIGYLILTNTSESHFQDAGSPLLWTLIVILMFASISGNLRMISLTPIITLLFSDEERGKKNGLIGISNGVTFALTSVLSGLAIGYLGMEKTLLLTMLGLFIALIDLATITIHEKEILRSEHSKESKKMSTLKVIRNTPGFTGLVLFTVLNNLLGGVFMALIDAYGLSLVSVQNWGFLWGFLSLMAIGGGLFTSRYGTGEDPIKTLILLNIAMWATCIFFPLKASILLLGIGGMIWMLFTPIIEASEQSIIQKVIPLRQQGRVVGVMQSAENATAPLTSLVIGPITQIWIVPFMTDGWGAPWIGPWFGTGQARAIALVFIVAGILGTLLSIGVYFSKTRRTLTRLYKKK